MMDSTQRRFGRHLLLILGLLTCGTPFAQAQLRMNRGAVFSEDDQTAAALEVSLTGFLGEIRAGAYTDEYVNPLDLERHGFFFDGLLGIDAEPLVLKSHTLDGPVYWITVAFMDHGKDAVDLHKLVELKATPHGAGYRFNSPFDDRVAGYRTETIGGTTFHFKGELDRELATEFDHFKSSLEGLTGTPQRSLDYYRFDSLDQLLKAYGLLYDCTKCNFLGRDLGFLDDGGRRYVTGTGDERYIFGFARGALGAAPVSDTIYGPAATGMAAYYGGYGLSGDSIEVLRAQFRQRLAEEPDIDFLAEFKKGRGSSVNRHFSHYVMCAFFYAEALERVGGEAAMSLVHSGADGEHFFERLGESLGVTEANFHGTVLRLIGAEPERRPERK